MKKLALLLLAAALFGTACTSQDIAILTEQGMLLADKDPEKAKQVGEAAGKLAGAVGEMDPETKRAIGGGIALKSYAQRGPLYPDDELQRYVNLVGQTVAQYSVQPDLAYTFAVVDSDIVNAWAAPGGYVFITKGALAKMENEAQLAGVLAHEVVHVSEDHMIKMMKRSQLFEGATELAQATTSKDLTKYTSVVDEGTNILFEKGIDRTMEFDADLIGLEYATAAGYAPDGLVNYLEGLRVTVGDTGGGWLSSTHPTIQSRVIKARQKLREDLAGFEGVEQKERFQNMMRRHLR